MSGNLTPPPGLDRTALLANLTAAQTALHQLMIGANTTTVTYATGEGQRSVTYTPTNIRQLQGYIASLQMQLGYRSRRAIVPSFR